MLDPGTINLLTIFILAIFVGNEVISKVPPTLHTPLMSGSNAISGIAVVGAILAIHTEGTLGTYLGLAALIFAKWRPWYVLMACLLFGFLEAISNRYQNIELLDFVLPVQFMQALPYILTVLILAGFVGKAIPPKAGGVPYAKER